MTTHKMRLGDWTIVTSPVSRFRKNHSKELRIIAFVHLDGGGLDAPEGLSAYEGNDVQVFSAVSESKPEQLYTSNEHSDAIIAKLERHAGSFTPHLDVVRLPRQVPTVRGEPLPRNFP